MGPFDSPNNPVKQINKTGIIIVVVVNIPISTAEEVEARAVQVTHPTNTSTGGGSPKANPDLLQSCCFS